MIDFIIERSLEGKCPVCKEDLHFVKKTPQEVEETIKVVNYKDVPIMICKDHPSPND